MDIEGYEFPVGLYYEQNHFGPGLRAISGLWG